MTLPAETYPPIGDYAIIGNCRSAALVSRDGSVDWLCLPRFDSPSLFSALLDAHGGGRFRVRPSGEFVPDRRYLPHTNVLETTFRCPSGTVVLRDVMPVAADLDKPQALMAEHEVLREIAGVAGEVEMEVVYDPRPGYARRRARLESRGELGLWCETGRGALLLRSDLPLRLIEAGAAARGVGRVAAGDRLYLSCSYGEESPLVIPPLSGHARGRLDGSARWWRSWAARLKCGRRYRDALERSILALKLLVYAPSGAVLAAPTTSLPERVGGVRNWDYRYCWLRDASFTMRALHSLGCQEEADAFLSWLLHATRLTWPELQVVYDVYGESDLPEWEIDNLEGYQGSRPVRAGNRAARQLQLDVYGEVLEAVATFSDGAPFDTDTAKMLRGLGETVCKRWRQPDNGIWEQPSGLSHYTHSKALCWAALDCLIRMHESGWLSVPLTEFQTQREEIRAEIELRGYSDRIGSYTAILDGSLLDASVLTLPLHGYLDARHPRMLSTCQQVLQRLGRDGLVHRYEIETDDGLPPGEGAFGICSFWAVECLARTGAVDAAEAAFERLLSYANDVGLFAEEIDPSSGMALGNFPQAYTHVGLINAALTLAECQGEPGGARRPEAEGRVR